MGGHQQLARLAGGLVGIGIAFAAALPFTGVPPLGGSQSPLAPAQLEVLAAANGELTLDPVGPVLAATVLNPGVPGPRVTVSVRNITARDVQLRARLLPTEPGLADAVLVRGSVAGAVVFDGKLASTDEWSPPVGSLKSGATTKLRLRFTLVPGLAADQWRGQNAVRTIELKTVYPGSEVVPTTPGTTP